MQQHDCWTGIGQNLRTALLTGHSRFNLVDKYKLGIVGSTVFLLLLTQSTAQADGFSVTGQANLPVCMSVHADCTPVTFSMELATEPGQNNYGAVFNVVSLSGFVDGKYSITGTGGWLLPVIGNPQTPIPYGHINYTINNTLGLIYYDDHIGGSSFMSELPLIDGNSGGSAFVTWNAVFHASEPATWLMLLISLVVLKFLVFTLTKTCSGQSR